MKIEAGYDIAFTCPKATPALFLISVHPSRAADLVTADEATFSPHIPTSTYIDVFGNKVTRATLPAGTTTISSRFIVNDTGAPDVVAPDARQLPVDELPDDVLTFLLASRYCDTDLLTNDAWSLFEKATPGWARVQAICDYVHDRITFGYAHACATRTASQGHQEQIGVCRDFAHLAITLCRCMNIPARYCTGYLGDIGIPAVPDPMDFSAWFEVYLDGRWYTFDARHNVPRIGRIVMARGRDAADAAISTAFGAAQLARFEVITDEVPETRVPELRRIRKEANATARVDAVHADDDDGQRTVRRASAGR